VTQYNLEPFGKLIDQAGNRIDLLEHFENEDVQVSVAANIALIDSCDKTIYELELFLENRAKVHDGPTYYLLRSVPGIGKILSLTILYEIHKISRFPTVGQFLSYSRLVAGTRESAGKKKKASGGRKMGNVYHGSPSVPAHRIDVDLGSISGEHLGRLLAGFKNWKRRGRWVNVLTASVEYASGYGQGHSAAGDASGWVHFLDLVEPGDPNPSCTSQQASNCASGTPNHDQPVPCSGGVAKNYCLLAIRPRP
jgi:hypothetical protein